MFSSRTGSEYGARSIDSVSGAGLGLVDPFSGPPRCCLARPGASHFRPTLPTSLQVRLAGKRHLLGCQLVRHYDGSSLQPADSVIVTKSTVLSFHLLTSCSSPRTPCVLSAYGYKGKLVAGLRQRLAGSLTTYRRIFFCKPSSALTALAQGSHTHGLLTT